jgi:hypothetical protein
MFVGAELTGRPLLNVSLLPLIEPSWALFGGQVVLAVALWAAGWWLLARETVGMQQFEIN